MAGAGIRIDVQDAGAIAAVRRLVARVEDPRPAFDEIGSAMVASTIRRFEIEAGPGDVPWKKSRRAAREGGQTLTDSGRGRASITHNVLADGVEWGTNVPYLAVHQAGARTPPRTIRPKRRKALYWPGAAHPVAKVNHPGSVIPARPFLGVDERDRATIERIVARHLGLAP